jgi:hypothetical protein
LEGRGEPPSLRVLAGAMGKKFQWRFIVEIEEGK